MARSHCIYLVRSIPDGKLIAAFTVRREACDWANFVYENDIGTIRLSRIRDGLYPDKTEVPMPWETTPGDPTDVKV